MRLEIPFCGPAYESESHMISPEECINFYLRPYPEMGKDKMALVGTPGLRTFAYVNPGYEVRALLPFGHYLYAVVGNRFYRITELGIATEKGALNTTTGRVGIATNGLDVTLVDGPWGYVYDLGTDTFAQIADPDFPGGDTIIHTDGYYLVNRPGTGQVWRSDYNDGSSWYGLAFDTAGSRPDNVVGIVLDHKDIWALGESTTELYYNAGLPTFNFVKIEGAFIEQGGAAPHAHTTANNAVYWVGRDERGRGQVFQALGRQPKVVSTSPVSHHISQYDLSTSFMFSYQQVGHTHVVLQIPDADVTWVYDSSVGLWHQRSSITNGVPSKWMAEAHALFNDQHIVGAPDGYLYRMATDLYAEGGEQDSTEIISTRTTPILRDKQNPITINEVQVVHEPGVGLITDGEESVDPQAMFSWSRDAGKTWSAEVDMPLGKIGEYDGIAKVTQLGQGVNWVFRYRISAAVKKVVVGAVADVEGDDA